MKYRSYKVRTYEHGISDEGWGMQEFLHYINTRKEKIMHVIDIGNVGAYVNIITLGQDDDAS
jgi:hypothetical protein